MAKTKPTHPPLNRLMDATIALRIPQDLKDWLKAEAERQSGEYRVRVDASAVARLILDSARAKALAKTEARVLLRKAAR